VAPKLISAAGGAIKDVLEIGSRAGPALDRPQYAFNKDRGQYHATSILRRLSTLPPGEVQVMGLLEVDLFLPDAPYVIGDADRDAGAAVFSLARLSHAEPEVVRRRVRVESVHAVGHLLGLSHCTDFRCAMFFSRDAADSDRKGPGLCTGCRNALGIPPR
jgi:archaemetzincin